MFAQDALMIQGTLVLSFHASPRPGEFQKVFCILEGSQESKLARCGHAGVAGTRVLRDWAHRA